jgi:hypothetical protein
VTDPVAVHLKDFDGGEVRVTEGVVHLETGAEGSPLAVQLSRPTGSNRATSNGCLRSAEVTHETISCGGWHWAQEPGDCVGKYFMLKWERMGW